MRIAAYILIIILLNASCAGVRKMSNNETVPDKDLTAQKILDRTIKNNIGEKDFLINRFKISYTEGNESKERI